MRRLALAAMALTMTLGAASARADDPDTNPDGTLNPVVAIQVQDYALARAGFSTRLTRQGPSPQRMPMPPTPDGAQLVEFPSGGLKLKAWLGLPTAPAAPGAVPAAPPPVVIFVHGGFGFGQEDFDMAAPYRAAGFAVVTPILRGENGQAGSFSLFYDETSDVLALAAWLRGRRDLDGGRIYLAGHSTGGTLALLAAMAQPGFRAVASFSGSPDQVLYTRYGIRPGDIPFDARDDRELQMRSPLAYAASLKAPTRLYYGSEEGVFKLSTERLAAIAAAKGLDVAAQPIEGDHMSAIPAEVTASIAFFRLH